LAKEIVLIEGDLLLHFASIARRTTRAMEGKNLGGWEEK